jgi:hypothetical protein
MTEIGAHLLEGPRDRVSGGAGVVSEELRII